jgi:hypothetical protein
LSPGAVLMTLGEYVSVSSQRDSERAQITQEKRELADTPDAELTELTALYEAKGLSAGTARTVAAELTARDALAAHLDAELHIDPADIPVRFRPQALRRCLLFPAPCCRCWPSCCLQPPCGASGFRCRPGCSRLDLCRQCPPGWQQCPPRCRTGGRGWGPGLGLHLRHRAPVRHRDPLRDISLRALSGLLQLSSR